MFSIKFVLSDDRNHLVNVKNLVKKKKKTDPVKVVCQRTANTRTRHGFGNADEPLY